MKVLYIAEKIAVESGGSMGNRRNYTVLQEYFGTANLISYGVTPQKYTALRKVYSELKYKNIFNIENSQKANIIELITLTKVDIVWLDSSNLGFLAKLIRDFNKKIKILTFFHNVEFKFMLDQLKLTQNPKFLYRIFLAYYNEKIACKYSDKILCYNKRDAKKILQKYGRYPDVLIPISLKDDFASNIVYKQSADMTALFLGSNFPPNIAGIKWFVKNVLPCTSLKLIIAGSGMEVLKQDFQNIDKVKVIGFVENLQELYASVSFLVMPIFSGSGMKVKTAEALKYGKFIFASSEAIEGYEVTQNEVCICDDAKSYIDNIELKGPLIDSFNLSSRKLFLTHYSYNVTKKLFADLFSSIGL